MLFRILKSFIIGIAFIILFEGCAPSSSSQRYGQSKTKKEQQKKLVRYSKQDTSKKDTIKLKPSSENTIDTTQEEFDEMPVEENPIDKEKFVANYKNYINPDVPLSFRERILLEIIKYLDAPYKYGGNSNDGIDCSGFTRQIFLNTFSIELPRSAREQFQIGEKVEKNELEFGDLVFFNTSRRSKPGHVGIYIGDNQFVHSSRKLGVTISSLNEKYYAKRYYGARRIEIPSE
ncbi:C40 family peptidase [Rosettibacter firmus]|uniref:C40 family peptidase n=1 Tax=Rosettibacter firmus TaxID=3111522 RepID=UPI00336BE8FF